MTSLGRILVVDDEAVVRMVCRRVLEDAGYAVTLARGGEEALGILSSAPFEAVLLDIKMPGLSGVEVLGRIRETWPHLPVVIITGYATLEQRREVERQGATTWLPKPFGPPELQDALERILPR